MALILFMLYLINASNVSDVSININVNSESPSAQAVDKTEVFNFVQNLVSITFTTPSSVFRVGVVVFELRYSLISSFTLSQCLSHLK